MNLALTPARTVALVAVRDLENSFYSFWRPQVFSIDERAARLAASSLAEGHYTALSAVAGLLHLPFSAEDAFCREHAITYSQIRNWLHGDCEFDYGVACRVALAFTTRHGRRLMRNS